MFRGLVFRPLRNDWSRSLLSVLAVALGVGVVIAIRVANRSALASFQNSTQSLAAGAELLATGPAPLDAGILARLRPLTAQAEFTPYLDRRAYNPATGDTLEILGLDLVAKNGLWLAAPYAAAHGLKPGSTVTLVIGGVDHAFPVAGLLPASAAQPADFALLDLPAALAAFEPASVGRPSGPPAGLRPAPLPISSSPPNAKRPPAATPPSPTFDGLRINLAPGVSAAAIAAAVQPLLPPPDTVVTPRARSLGQERMLAAFRANLEALAYVSLLVGIFLIYNTVSISVVRRREQTATLRALGATRRQLLRMFLVEGAALSLAGGAVGLGVGWALAAGALGLMQRTINSLYAAVQPARASLQPRDVAWALGLGLAAGVLAAWAPARAATAASPAQAMRPGSAEQPLRHRHAAALAAAAALALLALLLARLPEPAGGVPWVGFGSALAAVLAWTALTPAVLAALLPRLRAFLLARRHMAAGLAAGALAGALRRSAVLTAAVATAIGVMLGVAIMVGSFRQTVALWLDQQLQAAVFVRPADWDRNHPVPIAPELAARLLATPGAGAIEADHLQRWTFRGLPVLLDTHWAAAGPGAPPRQRFLDGGTGPVIVSEPFARRFHLWAGDPIAITGSHGTLRARVAGVFYDYTSSEGEIVLAPASFRQAFGAPAITELGFDPAAGVSAAVLEAQINQRLLGRTGMVVTNNRQLRAAAMRVFDQTFQITYALEVITLLVAVLGVANTLLAVVLERGRELAILQALGAVRRQLRHMLLAEAAVVASLALALGWGIGITLAWILVRVINVQSFGWTILWHWPWLYLALASALVWLATLAAGWLPARTAERTIAPALLEAE